MKTKPIVYETELSVLLNNNKKYYMYVGFKNKLEKCNNNYNILYFFPDKSTISSYLQIKNTLNDFYVEIDSYFRDSYLFEGYFYNNSEYLITDVLFKNDSVINMDYPLRQSLVMELISNKSFNNVININVHPVFDAGNEHILKVFQRNFIYANELIAKEIIYDFNKINNILDITDITNITDSKETDKLITKGKSYDVYNVYNINSGDYEGILYIRGISESRYMKNLFKRTSEKIMKCNYNKTFYKWFPVIDPEKSI